MPCSFSVIFILVVVVNLEGMRIPISFHNSTLYGTRDKSIFQWLSGRRDSRERIEEEISSRFFKLAFYPVVYSTRHTNKMSLQNFLLEGILPIRVVIRGLAWIALQSYSYSWVLHTSSTMNAHFAIHSNKNWGKSFVMVCGNEKIHYRSSIFHIFQFANCSSMESYR